MDQAGGDLPLLGKLAGAELEALDRERVALVSAHQSLDGVVELKAPGDVLFVEVRLLRPVDQLIGDIFRSLPGALACQGTLHFLGEFFVRNLCYGDAVPLLEILKIVDAGDRCDRWQAAIGREQDASFPEHLPGSEQRQEPPQLGFVCRRVRLLALAPAVGTDVHGSAAQPVHDDGSVETFADVKGRHRVPAGLDKYRVGLLSVARQFAQFGFRELEVFRKGYVHRCQELDAGVPPEPLGDVTRPSGKVGLGGCLFLRA
jgi:hypothetical protein